jgi:GT2 family glycosyltransferase
MILIVPVLNRYDLLNRMIRSIDKKIYKLLVIDNGAETSAANDQIVCDNPMVEDLHVLPMPNNLGVGASWNLGIKLLPFEPVWFFSSADTVYEPGALEELSKAKTDEISLAADFPYWQTFAIGQEVVKKIGLFDESIYPIYFEDTEYIWRAENAGINLVRLNVKTHHDNSSTIKSDANYSTQNDRTYSSNRQYFSDKKARSDYSPGQWNLDRVRSNFWQG